MHKRQCHSRIGLKTPWACWECNSKHLPCTLTPSEVKARLGRGKGAQTKQTDATRVADGIDTLNYHMQEVRDGMQMMALAQLQTMKEVGRIARALEKGLGVEPPEWAMDGEKLADEILKRAEEDARRRPLVTTVYTRAGEPEAGGSHGPGTMEETLRDSEDEYESVTEEGKRKRKNKRRGGDGGPPPKK